MSTYNDSFTPAFMSRYFHSASEDFGTGHVTARKRVLCLDDDLLSLRLLERFLRDSFEVHSCSSIHQAIRISRKFAIDTFICDYHLGDDMTGTKALQILGSLDQFFARNKILITARPTPEIEAEVRAAGFHEVFPKPLGRAFQSHCKAL